MSDMEPVEIPAVQYLTTPPFSSNDPATEGLRMIPVDDSPVDPEWSDAETAGELKATDWVAAVEGAADQDALDEVLSAYAETGKDYKTVSEAAEKKQAELDA